MAAKRRQENVPIETPGEERFVNLEEAFTRVILELTEMRIRQRALLEVIGEHEFSWPSYVDAVRTVRQRDFDALFNSIVMKTDVFVTEFDEWVKADRSRYSYQMQPEASELKPKPTRSRVKKAR